MNSWLKKGIVYQIYPRSFCDSNGDGVGDLRGIIGKLDYISSLGVTAVWLNPIFKSPNEDGGYDISDYYSIQPEFGTMQDFDELLAGLHQRNMKLIIDLVLNHSSDEHFWFEQSKKSKDNPYRDFYFWKPGKKESPPNNWKSFFGGRAWRHDHHTDEYYLHLFSHKQPDLNWENKELREEIKKILRFWLDKGVDGLRLDFITAISKQVDFPNTDTSDFNETIRRFYTNGPRLKEFIAELRTEVFDHYDVMTIGEGPGITPENALDYLDKEKGLSIIFHFGHMFLDQGKGGRFDSQPWSMKGFKEIFAMWDKTFSSQGWGSVFLGNHDFARMVSRWGNDGEYREQSSKLLITLLLTMRGTPFIFQGDEIGMTNIVLNSISESKDVETLNGWREAKKAGVAETDFLKRVNYSGRDNARTPMQWNESENAGFTEANPWMRINSNHKTINVSKQDDEADSILNYFRKMTRLRKECVALTEGNFNPIETVNEDLFVFSRNTSSEKIIVVLNFSSSEMNLPFDTAGMKTLICNYTDTISAKLKPWQASVFQASS